MKILGIDPGFEHTGWGVITCVGNSLSYVASGVIKTNSKDEAATRLVCLAKGLGEVIAAHNPACAAVEEVIVNKNARSSLTLGQARGICLMVPAQLGLPVHEYAALLVKKSVVGTGKAEKEQVAHMVKVLLPRAAPARHDESDALAVAITHSQHMAYAALVKKVG
jgi:crossover junction endodeoxyribonuclease RuvC